MVGLAETRSLLSWAGQLPFVVRGGSMGPVFRHGRLRVGILPAGSLRGRVVVYPLADGRRFVAHRVVDDRGATLVCRGDANDHLEHVPRSEVIGVMTALILGRKPLQLTLPWRVEHLLSRPSSQALGFWRELRRTAADRAAG